MTTIITKSELQVIKDVLKRIDGVHLLDFDADIFDFTLYSTKDFLLELPKVVDILSKHKEEISYNNFIKSLSNVVLIITEIYEWKFCLDVLKDLCQSMYDSNVELIEKGGAV